MEYLLAHWLEIVGLISGLLCVVLLVRENLATFPIGLLYALVSVVVMFRTQLYADVLLNLYYVVMNAYGWYFWLRGDPSRRLRAEGQALLPGWVPSTLWLPLGAILVTGTLGMGWYFATFTAADLAYPDSFTTVASFVAMWMSARKYLESWVAWFVIDVVQVGLYLYKGIHAYALLYFVYLGLAVWGWRAWSAHVVDQRPQRRVS